MVVEFHGPRPLLNVPEHTRHVAGRGDDLPVVYEAAAAEVPGVCAELSGDLDLPARRARRARPRSAQGVDGADVVEATAGDEVPGGGIGGGHDPGGAEWDGVDLVGGVGVPDDELAVLGGGRSGPAPLAACPSDRPPPAARPRSCPGCPAWGETTRGGRRRNGSEKYTCGADWTPKGGGPCASHSI